MVWPLHFKVMKAESKNATQAKPRHSVTTTSQHTGIDQTEFLGFLVIQCEVFIVLTIIADLDIYW